MGITKKVLGINFIILIIYMGLCAGNFFLLTKYSKSTGASMEAIMALLFPFICITLHIIVLGITSSYFFAKQSIALGQAYLLTLLILTVIGFSPCWASSFYALIEAF